MNKHKKIIIASLLLVAVVVSAAAWGAKHGSRSYRSDEMGVSLQYDKSSRLTELLERAGTSIYIEKSKSYFSGASVYGVGLIRSDHDSGMIGVINKNCGPLIRVTDSVKACRYSRVWPNNPAFDPALAGAPQRIIYAIVDGKIYDISLIGSDIKKGDEFLKTVKIDGADIDFSTIPETVTSSTQK